MSSESLRVSTPMPQEDPSKDRPRPSLRALIGQVLTITLIDGRTIKGYFTCVDKQCNIILNEAEEFRPRPASLIAKEQALLEGRPIEGKLAEESDEEKDMRLDGEVGHYLCGLEVNEAFSSSMKSPFPIAFQRPRQCILGHSIGIIRMWVGRRIRAVPETTEACLSPLSPLFAFRRLVYRSPTTRVLRKEAILYVNQLACNWH
ncbi:hypothetical protein I308_105177 [Cryptococcus tetragattii IND107]|uniref:Sm domain-containing protein n=1 Tax=Cryptococcus tetragattii IND107 TaxID=1296105 RepID=A0ABR3BM96_9TREE